MSAAQTISQIPAPAQDPLEAVIAMISAFRDEHLRRITAERDPNRVVFHADAACTALTLKEKIEDFAAGRSPSPQLSPIHGI